VAEAALELIAPAQLNIVCFRYVADESDNINAEIVTELHESGVAAPSVTTIDGKLAIRAALFNHRTQAADLDVLIAAVLQIGSRIAAAKSHQPPASYLSWMA
jgi:aromatic-L-amino-acid decarboxylase